jgi:uncharacterized surface protein with fasciclin (FAS1) repeats
MITRTRSARLVAALAAVTFVAAACGSDDDSVEPASTDAAMTTEPMDDSMDEPMTTEPMDDSMDEPMTTEPMDDSMDDSMGAEPFGPACAAVPAEGEGSFAGMTDDTAATAASNNPLLSTLVTAVGEAGLVDTLNSDGPFTIFAPTNDAFAAIPEDDLAAVLADEDLLTSILTFHVVAGESLDAEALGAAGSAASVNGAELSFSADGTQVNGVDVLCSNVVTANATVHIIGEVLMP